MPEAPARPWTRTPHGLRMTVHLTPKSSRDAIEAIVLQSDGKPVLKVRVRAVPEDGKANLALLETLARALHMPRNAVSLEAGGKSRTKIIALEGEPQSLEASLEDLLSTAGGKRPA